MLHISEGITKVVRNNKNGKVTIRQSWYGKEKIISEKNIYISGKCANLKERSGD